MFYQQCHFIFLRYLPHEIAYLDTIPLGFGGPCRFFFVEVFIVPFILCYSKKLSSFLLFKYNIWYPRYKASSVSQLTPRCNHPQALSKTCVYLIS